MQSTRRSRPWAAHGRERLADLAFVLPVLAVLAVFLAWLVMQPGMGLGIAASRSPRPAATRLRNLATHAVYGIGMYGAALALSAL